MVVMVPQMLRTFLLVVLATFAKWQMEKAPVSMGVPDNAH